MPPNISNYILEKSPQTKKKYETQFTQADIETGVEGRFSPRPPFFLCFYCSANLSYDELLFGCSCCLQPLYSWDYCDACSHEESLSVLQKATSGFLIPLVYLFSIYSDLFCTSTLSKGKETGLRICMPRLDYHRINLNLLLVKLVFQQANTTAKDAMSKGQCLLSTE